MPCAPGGGRERDVRAPAVPDPDRPAAIAWGAMPATAAGERLTSPAQTRYKEARPSPAASRPPPVHRMPVETRLASPRIELVVAAARNGVIGRGNTLPWHLPEDLKHFKRLTLGRPILMGRRTWDSIGRPLPGRQNLVLTRDPQFQPAGATVVRSLAEATAAAGAAEALMVIGGADLFELCLPLARVMHLTEIDAHVEGDVWFPRWRREDWRESSRDPHPADERHAFPYAFVTLERRAS